MNITLLEPQCSGLTHVPFNAALLRTVLSAIPDASVVFSGESNHVTRVREALGDPGLARKIDWRFAFGGIPRGDRLADLPRLFAACFRLCQYCKREKVEVLVLCYSSPALLAAIAAMRPRSTAVVVVLHACVADLNFNILTQCLRNPFCMHSVARIPLPPGMRAVVLGRPILKNMQTMGLASSRWESMDLPSQSLEDEPHGLPPLPVRFGYLAGWERNGSNTRDMLERVKRATGCEINWIGRENSVSEALPPDEYRKRLSEVHYAVWLGDASTFRLRASATFLDAIAMGKPLIYLKNDFIDYYNSHRGPFGLPVSSVGELEENLVLLARAPLDEKYKTLSRTARAVSHTFSPETVAPSLRSIMQAARDETKKQ